jgi:ubiquinone/menaquinone biosynthesis C-methylase UbiE
MSLYEQFGHPRGLAGWLIGNLMAVKNARRSHSVLQELAARPGEKILEVGFGPGVDVERVLEAVGEAGAIAGVDISETMVAQARRRNRAAYDLGRADLRLGTVAALPFPSESFDAAFSINTAQFWPELVRGLIELGRVVRPGGRILIAVQPMHRGANTADSERWLDRLRNAATTAGLRVRSTRLGDTRPPVAQVMLETPRRG